MTNAAPPGWYTHPTSPGHEHWWDGTQYTQSRPVQAMVQYVPRLIPVGTSPKSRTVASLLSFFLGGFGVDRFYLGNIGMGVAKLLLGWATAGIWPLIDFIIIVAGASHDGDGLAVTNWE
jgi:TM2 domain-containing membrane protein YozV